VLIFCLPVCSLKTKIKIYKTIILTIVPREEYRLRVFENRVLRRIFGPMKEEVTGGWRKLHNEELHNLYTSQNIIRVIKSEHVAWMAEMRNTIFWLENLGLDGKIILEWILGK
jgi:hypothetical protein